MFDLFYLYIQLEAAGANNAWIGLNRLTVSDGHEWSDKSPLEFYNWRDGEPNDALGQESCVSLFPFDG